MTYYIAWAIEREGKNSFECEFVYLEEIDERTLSFLISDRLREKNADKVTIVFIAKLPV